MKLLNRFGDWFDRKVLKKPTEAEIADFFAEENRVRDEYGKLFDEVLIIFEDLHCADDYEPAVTAILPQLGFCGSAEDTQKVMHEALVGVLEWPEHWPNRTVQQSAYRKVAEQIWSAWLRYQSD